MLVIQAMAPIMLKAMNRRYVISAAPATTGAKVRAIGMNCAKIIVLPPCRS
jgi:hypothetical protein